MSLGNSRIIGRKLEIGEWKSELGKVVGCCLDRGEGFDYNSRILGRLAQVVRAQS
jgi:hypothetical protein